MSPVLHSSPINSSTNTMSGNTLEDAVLKMLNKDVKVNVSQSDISAIHYLANKSNSSDDDGDEENKKPRNIVVQFVNRKTKDIILKNARNLAGKKIWINEHLTKANMMLHKRARELRSKGALEGVWTKNCKVLVKAAKDKKVYAITTMSDFTTNDLENPPEEAT